MTSREEFSGKVKVHAFQRANGRCDKCTARLSVGKFHYDHIVPAAVGGAADLNNCQVLCTSCHGTKTAKVDVPAIAKSERIRRKHAGAKTTSGPPMPGSKRSGWKKPMNGPAERR